VILAGYLINRGTTMATQKDGGRRSEPASQLYRVQYWDRCWDELDYLRVDEATPREVEDYIAKWLFERHLLRRNKLHISALADAEYLTIGVPHEEE
jgi:hypothetical protein